MDQLLRDTFARHEELVPVAHPGLRAAIFSGARRRRARRRWAWTGLLSTLAVAVALLTGPVFALPRHTSPDVAAPKHPIHLLLVGIDRTGRDLPAQVRADAIVLLHIDPARRAAYAVVVPHDLLLDLPGLGRQRAEGAYLVGGYQLAADAMTRLTGVPLDGGAVVDVAAMEKITAAAGGVDLCVDRQVQSRHLADDGENPPGYERPAMVYQPGCRHFDAPEAVDYLRESVGSGNDRALHDYLVALAKAAAQPSRLPAVLAAAGSGLELHLGTGSLAGVAGMMRGVDPATVAGVRLPTVATAEGEQPGRLPVPGGDGLYDALRSGAVGPWLAAHPAYGS
ncbi:LCP family protein [Dactylosporangium salmoneum]|uniref:Cell envelope-related transcriptional attenuator domain-containing protein n=1 Tax=Dactylosporangium salmoneum TaxID=53361 RepID=A0ABN3FII8_9ACTN